MGMCAGAGGLVAEGEGQRDSEGQRGKREITEEERGKYMTHLLTLVRAQAGRVRPAGVGGGGAHARRGGEGDGRESRRGREGEIGGRETKTKREKRRGIELD